MVVVICPPFPLYFFRTTSPPSSCLLLSLSIFPPSPTQNPDGLSGPHALLLIFFSRVSLSHITSCVLVGLSLREMVDLEVGGRWGQVW